MEKETKKTLLKLLKFANEKGINETTFYKLNDIEDLLFYIMSCEMPIQMIMRLQSYEREK